MAGWIRSQMPLHSEYGEHKGSMGSVQVMVVFYTCLPLCHRFKLSLEVCVCQNKFIWAWLSPSTVYGLLYTMCDGVLHATMSSTPC